MGIRVPSSCSNWAREQNPYQGVIESPSRKELTTLHFAVDSRRPHRDKAAILETILNLAPHAVSLLEILDSDGNTPMMLAKKVKGREGEDLVEAFEDFHAAEEAALWRAAIFTKAAPK